MFNAGELYYLNMALDGKDIYGINPVESMISGQENQDSPEESLIKKNIITADEKLNFEAGKIINNLEKYKKAKEYIWVNDLIISLDNSNWVVFLKNEKKGQYRLEKIPKDIMVYEIIKNYKFLRNDTLVEENKEKNMPEEFIAKKILNKSRDKVLSIQKEKNKVFNICNVYYEEDNVYKYDLLKRELISVNPKNIRRELLDIFKIEVDK